jgi:ribonuclease HI
MAYRLYIATTDKTLGTVLTQEHVDKEFVVAYLSRRMLDTKTRYTHVEKLCLPLYYACSKFRHYILSSSCIVRCQHDVVKHMIQKLILNGRLGKWAYALVEYELTYEPLKAVKRQIVADFIIDHNINDDDTCLVAASPWKLFFNRSVCAQGCGIGCVIVSPKGMVQEIVTQLEFKCTNNQAKYKALVADLELLIEMQVKDVEAFGYSKLVTQQVLGEAQYLEGELNCYRELCLSLIQRLDMFHIKHVPREENKAANELAQQASGYEVT